MSKSKVIQFEKNEDTREQARQILKNGILDMSVERLIQMVNFGLCGNVEVMTGLCGTSHYFNRMEYVKTENEEECDIINYYFEEEEDIIASTTISIEHIEEISLLHRHLSDIIDSINRDILSSYDIKCFF